LKKEIIAFFNEIEGAYNSKLPFVVFRKSNEEIITAFVQNTDDLYELNSYNESGFLFAPFFNNEKKVLFPTDQCSSFTTIVQENNSLQIDLSSPVFKTDLTLKSKEKHIELVEKGIDFIKIKNAQKIVLSRNEIIECPNFDVINSYKKMLNNYKNAYVYLWFHPAVGLWMGATPEKLITINKLKFSTMALAGTQLYKGSIEVVWNEKEKKEQQFVTDFILENIKGSIENTTFSDAYSVKAGNLVHIRTDISGDLKSNNQLESLVASLHPTPAVCGLPKTIAIDFILQNEGYNRAYYSGYLGELNIQNCSNLVVNLRCMQLKNKSVTIYIGGGITIDSNPENEWQETVSKAEVIKNIL